MEAEFFGSNKKFCTEFLSNNKHYFHSGAVMSIIGDAPKLTIGFELYRSGVDSTSKDEGELNVAKRLLSDVSVNYKRFIDVVVYDALAFNSLWINHCQDLGVDVIVRAKENNITSLKQIKKKTNKQEPIAIWNNEKGFESVKIYESKFLMDNVKQPLRFVKFAMKYPDGKRSQIMII